ncbi:MAG: hypothetical protein LOD84_06135 [Limnochordales bacterium]
MQFSACGNYKIRYKDEATIFPNDTGRVFVAVLLLALASLPLWMSPYLVFVGTLIGIFVVGAVGLNILTGSTGQISLGHSAFMGLGAYAAGLLAQAGFPFWLAIPLAGGVAAAAGAFFGIPSLRVKGLYLALATLAAQVILQFAFNLFDSRGGGTSYLSVPEATLLGVTLDRDRLFYYVVLAAVVAGVLAALNLFRTRVGRAFTAIRDNDRAAAAMGINVFAYKLLAFSISAFYAGVAGALWAYASGVVSAERFTLLLSVEYLAMIIVGGLGSVLGAIMGATVITVRPEVLRVLADDPAAAVDIPAWCRMRGHEFVGRPSSIAYDVRRVAPTDR